MTTEAKARLLEKALKKANDERDGAQQDLAESRDAHAALLLVLAKEVGTGRAEAYASDAALPAYAEDPWMLWARRIAARQRGEG